MFPIPLRISGGRMAFGDVPEHIDQRLQEAVSARHDDPAVCERLLWEAHTLGPRVLPVYVALYRYYVHHQKLDEAERVCLIGLTQAASQGGFPADWRRLGRGAFATAVTAVAGFTLFTLKALAFIRLRRQDLATAQAILDRLRDLDPEDSVGYGVVASLAARMAGDET